MELPATSERGSTGNIRFQTLGSLQVINGFRDCAPRTPKVLQVLALLLVRANRVVPTRSLIKELWGEHGPRSAVTTIHTYICQLRKLIERENLVAESSAMLVTQSPGYLLRVEPGQLDLQDFWNLRQEGREHLARGRFTAASQSLRAALSLWIEHPLLNVKLGPHLSAHVVKLEEERRNTLQSAIEAELELDLHRELIPELRSLTTLYPSDEWLHRMLMVALDRSGRRGDALQVYQILRGTLAAELGIDPAPETQQAHQQLLR
ncbi:MULTISPECIES: AfsR/SARP family transcriptional regulator [Saccharothrix]|uniref:AfsR/SARP family transcriptional regulator n=1 Tax=Saccharothrix TaxID=2071 RepID=UPI000938FC60|nr:AfsR/SARP family transcriptional regulator [Saccharothrix sp. CB00851]OKI29954.1 SARP family transcriptional regulator [Saccharothrix sp. CB00851]